MPDDDLKKLKFPLYNFYLSVSSRVRYRQRFLQNFIISGRMVITGTADFSDGNSVVCTYSRYLASVSYHKHRYAVWLCNSDTVLFSVRYEVKRHTFFRFFFRISNHQTTCNSLIVLLNVILYIETVLAIREAVFEVMHFV